MTLDTLDLKSKLDQILALPGLLTHARDKDPIGLVYPYRSKDDLEIVAFIVSSLSYGRQSVFRPIIQTILDKLGQHPTQYILKTNPKEWEIIFKGFRYRFNDDKDLVGLLTALKFIYSKSSLKEVYLDRFEGSTKPALSSLVKLLRESSKCESKSFRYLLPDPEDGSACKRLNMFLRWMVRRDDIDIGIWNNIPPSSLIIPLDTHVARISKLLNLTKRKDTSWKTAEEVTKTLRLLDAEDPVRYDFALCTSGILGML